MRVPGTNRGRGELDVPMTPMIDVVFQLLIFFICTASFKMGENLLPTSLASISGSSVASAAEPEPTLEQVVIRGERIADRTAWTVNDRRCEGLAEVRGVLHAIADIDQSLSLPVILDVGALVPLGDMIDVYDQCRLVGFRKIQFAAHRAPVAGPLPSPGE